jgi:surfactin synthase thioesterase subunit
VPTASPFFAEPPDPSAGVRLVCFPHAGGGASLFARWKSLLPPEVQVHPARLPGRETRLREPLVERTELLVAEVMAAVAGFADRPLALFGYSMGALLAFEVARALDRSGTPPAALFVAALRAPQTETARPRIAHLPEAEFLTALQLRYGGMPAEILREPELLRLFVPILRADLAVVENYRYEPGPPLPCPVRCFAGTLDTSVTRPELEAWAEQTRGGFAFQQVPGDHFFIKGQAPLLAAAVAHDLAAVGR